RFSRDWSSDVCSSDLGGSIYVTRPDQGDVLRLADANDDGLAEVIQSVTSGYPLIHGIAFDGDTVYLATPKQVLRGTVAGDGSFRSEERRVGTEGGEAG